MPRFELFPTFGRGVFAAGYRIAGNGQLKSERRAKRQSGKAGLGQGAERLEAGPLDEFVR